MYLCNVPTVFGKYSATIHVARKREVSKYPRMTVWYLVIFKYDSPLSIVIG